MQKIIVVILVGFLGLLGCGEDNQVPTGASNVSVLPEMNFEPSSTGQPVVVQDFKPEAHDISLEENGRWVTTHVTNVSPDPITAVLMCYSYVTQGGNSQTYFDHGIKTWLEGGKRLRAEVPLCGGYYCYLVIVEEGWEPPSEITYGQELNGEILKGYQVSSDMAEKCVGCSDVRAYLVGVMHEHICCDNVIRACFSANTSIPGTAFINWDTLNVLDGGYNRQKRVDFNWGNSGCDIQDLDWARKPGDDIYKFITVTFSYKLKNGETCSDQRQCIVFNEPVY